MRIATEILMSNPSYVEKMEYAKAAKRGFAERRKMNAEAKRLRLCVEAELTCEELQMEIEKHFPKGSVEWEALDRATAKATLWFCEELKSSDIPEAYEKAERYVNMVRVELKDIHLPLFDSVKGALVGLTGLNFRNTSKVRDMLDKAHSVRLSAIVGKECPNLEGENALKVGQLILDLPLEVKEIIQSMDDLLREIKKAGMEIPACLLPKPVVTSPEPGHLQVTIEETVKGEPLPFPTGKKTPAQRLVELNTLRKRSHKTQK